jgi:hypothetical protein
MMGTAVQAWPPRHACPGHTPSVPSLRAKTGLDSVLLHGGCWALLQSSDTLTSGRGDVSSAGLLHELLTREPIVMRRHEGKAINSRLLCFLHQLHIRLATDLQCNANMSSESWHSSKTLVAGATVYLWLDCRSVPLRHLIHEVV